METVAKVSYFYRPSGANRLYTRSSETSETFATITQRHKPTGILGLSQ